MTSHSEFLQQALSEARRGLAANEVPVGCVVVRGGEVVARAHNMTNAEHDPLCHAEYMALRELMRKGTAVEDACFYITVEPCVMCHGVLSRAGCRVVFGCFNEIFGTRKLTGGTAGEHVPDAGCVEVLREFYRTENSEAPESKRIRK